MLGHNDFTIGDSAEVRPCAGTDLGLWFGPADDVDPLLAETPNERSFRERTAKGVCSSCPVAAQCLEDELAFGIGKQWGVRGGMTAKERQELIRQRQIAGTAPAAEQEVA